jgi:hypothetical protein
MPDKELLVIDAADLPNRKLTITYQAPSYGDYRKAKRIYPYPTRESEVGPNYSVEELLFASMLTKIEVKTEASNKEIPMEAQDLPSRLASFPIDDRQAMMIEFIETNFLDKDYSRSAKAFAVEERVKPLTQTTVIPGSITPSGKSYVLNRPNTSTQWKADNSYKSAQENGCTLDEMLVAMCLQSIDQTAITELPKDIMCLLDEERIDDVQFICTIFVNLFLLDNDGAEAAKARGKLKKAALGKKKSPSKRVSTPTATLA